MEVKGKIIQKFDLQSGTSKAGNLWKKQGIPRKIYFDFFGDRADQFNFNVGDVINLYFDIESREYQGRYYTDIRGWKAEKVVDTPAGAAPAAAPAPAAAAPAPEPMAPAPSVDNLTPTAEVILPS